MKWKILDTGSASAQKNMALDYELLQGLSSTSQPILHLYEWEEDAATYGHFLNPYTFLNKEAVEKHRLQLARRPTGGGLVFHTADFAYSLLIPAGHPSYTVNTLENYAFVHRLVAKVVHRFLGTKTCPELLAEPAPRQRDHASRFCMASPTKYDVMWEGRKVGGGAQRRTREGYLHQGTISLAMPDDALLQDILLEATVYRQMQANSHFFLLGSFTPEQLTAVRCEIKGLFRGIFHDEAELAQIARRL